MATVTSSTFNSDYKAYFTYTTSSTNTTYSIKVTAAGLYQSCSWSEYPWKTSLTATSYSTRTATKGTVYWTKGYHALITADKTYSYTKGTAAKTVKISATTKKNVSGGGSGTASKSFTVPAKPTYSITYNLAGGYFNTAPTTAQKTKTYDTTYTIYSEKPKRTPEVDEDGVATNYYFIKYTGSNGASYQPGSSYATNAALTLTAVWDTEQKYNVSYSLGFTPKYSTDSVQSEFQDQTKIENTTLVLNNKTPSRYGYKFLNWKGNGTTYSPGANYTANSEVTLSAQWAAWTHPVNFNLQGGTGMYPSFTKATDIDMILPFDEPEKSGYIFQYWCTTADGTGKKYPAGSVYTETQNGGSVTLYAIFWKNDIYFYNTGKVCRAMQFKEGFDIISFDDNGDVELSEVKEGQTKFDLNLTSFEVGELKEGF